MWQSPPGKVGRALLLLCQAQESLQETKGLPR